MHVRWGIAGCGWVARDYVAPAIIGSSNGRLAALHDVSPAALAQAASLFPQAQACAGPGGVLRGDRRRLHRGAQRCPPQAGRGRRRRRHSRVVREADGHHDRRCPRHGRRLRACRHPLRHRLRPTLSTRRTGTLADLVRSSTLGTVTAIRIAYCCWVGADFQGDNWRIDPCPGRRRGADRPGAARPRPCQLPVERSPGRHRRHGTIASARLRRRRWCPADRPIRPGCVGAAARRL